MAKYVSDSAMKPALKARWVEALRSGKYKKTVSSLEDSDGYCCLGVLCKVSKSKALRSRGDAQFGDSFEQSELNEVMRQAVGLGEQDMRTLIRLNDGSDGPGFKKPRSFKQIADWIEKNLSIKEAKTKKKAA